MIPCWLARVRTLRRTNHSNLRQTHRDTEWIGVSFPSHRAVSTPSFEWPIAFVGYAMFARRAGASVTVDEANAACHGGHDF